MKRVYLDHAAATPADPRVEEAMRPFWVEKFGNAGGLYEEGRIAKEVLGQARVKIARLIGAKPDEIIFTSGGTESDNLAIFGVAYGANHLFSSRLNPREGISISHPPASSAKKKPRIAGSDDDSDSKWFVPKAIKPHIITTKFEHHAVFEPCQQLAKEGYEVTFLDVGEDGIVNPEDVEKALRPETILVSVMYANNEIGTIQPIAEISKIIRNFRSTNSYFHTDACQAAGYLDLNVNNLGVDLMTVNGSKIYGPKGAGFLYVRRGVKIAPQILGGRQEMGLRAGTEPVGLSVGLSKALEIAQNEKESESNRLTALRNYFIEQLLNKIPKAVLNGHPTKRLPNNINISVPGANGEEMVIHLDAAGIACSTGSACSSELSEPSHVILSLGRSRELANSSLRLTMGRSTTKEDLDYVLEKLPAIMNKLHGAGS